MNIKTARPVIITAVDEGYSVDVFKTAKAAWERFSRSGLKLSEDAQEPMTEKAFREALKSRGEVKLYEENSDDWAYKVTAHERSR